MADPTYDREAIRENPEWDLAFVLSEIQNDSAPIGWGKYRFTAACLLAHYDISPKRQAPEGHQVFKCKCGGTTYKICQDENKEIYGLCMTCGIQGESHGS